MYVCMYIYIYICIHISLSLYLSLPLSIYLSLSLSLYIYIYIHTHTYTHTHTHTVLFTLRGGQEIIRGLFGEEADVDIEGLRLKTREMLVEASLTGTLRNMMQTAKEQAEGSPSQIEDIRVLAAGEEATTPI